MIVSRTAFKLKFGQAKPAIAIWKEIMGVETAGGPARPGMRLLTDMSGPNYTLVAELQLRSFTEMAPESHVWSTNEKIRELYPKFVPLCEDSRADLLHVEQQIGEPCPAGNILERMVFSLKFGQAREAIAIWKEILNEARSRPEMPSIRLLSDITGPSYTLVMEMHYRNMMDFGPKMGRWLGDEKFQQLYARFVPLCERSERTLYKMEHCV